jgi:hypothetical protein
VTIDLAALDRPVEPEEIALFATPYLTLTPTGRVFRWDGSGAFVRHYVHTHPHGVVEWGVWGGSRELQTTVVVLAEGETAEEWLVKTRRSGADALHANRVLVAHGYSPTQHVGRPDCTCEDCEPRPARLSRRAHTACPPRLPRLPGAR